MENKKQELKEERIEDYEKWRKENLFKDMTIEEISKEAMEYMNRQQKIKKNMDSDGNGDFTEERQNMDITRDEFLKYAAEHGETI